MILLVNDDGIEADGLRALYSALRKRCNVPVLALAPSAQHSGQSHAITLDRGLTVSPINETGFFGFTIDGTPCDCIKLGIKVLCHTDPLLVISGINHGPNVGRSLFYSGTVGAAMEAAVEGYTGIAISQDLGYDDYEDSAAFAAEIAHACLRRDELRGHVVNINTPASAKANWAETRFLKHGLSGFDEQYKAVSDSGDRITWHLEGTRVEHSWEDETDAHALRNGHPTISLLKPDFNSPSNDAQQAANKRLVKASKRWYTTHAPAEQHDEIDAE